MSKKLPISYENERKYLKQPTWEQISDFIKEQGVSMYAFERFYGIPYNTLTQVKAGTKNLATRFWHFIYERIKPAYGVGFIDDFTKKQLKKGKKPLLTQRLTAKSATKISFNGRIMKVK